jgi:hypothetical protein
MLRPGAQSERKRFSPENRGAECESTTNPSPWAGYPITPCGENVVQHAEVARYREASVPKRMLAETTSGDRAKTRTANASPSGPQSDSWPITQTRRSDRNTPEIPTVHHVEAKDCQERESENAVCWRATEGFDQDPAAESQYPSGPKLMHIDADLVEVFDLIPMDPKRDGLAPREWLLSGG